MKFKFALATLASAAALVAATPAAAALWTWGYTGDSIQASGTFTTSDLADASGFYEITDITGTRNGVAITGLYPTGSAIPGNEPFELDNLVRIGADGQLTTHGFGFTTAAGDYSNPFYASFLDPKVYLEVFTTAAGDYFELPVSFTAAIAEVPEPASVLLVLAGLGAAGFASRRRLAR